MGRGKEVDDGQIRPIDDELPARPRKGARWLHISENTWWWRLGRSNVEIWDPAGRKTVVDLSTLTGWSWDELERAQWKQYFSLKPAAVKEYIEKNLI